jgi:DNA-binding transcriptional regulator YiaG
MSTDQAAIEQRLHQIREGLTGFYAVIADAIDHLGEGNPEAAFKLASTHQDALRRFHGQEENRAARLRARQAARIRDRDALSLAGLANRIGVSRSRADQLVKAAKEPEEATP